MIVELVVKALSALLRAVLGMFPDSDAPTWLDDGNTYLTQIWAAGAGLGAWVPWSLVGTVFTAVLACVVIGFGIRVTRIVLSLFTAGGGSAG